METDSINSVQSSLKSKVSWFVGIPVLHSNINSLKLYSRAAVVHLNFRAGSTFPVPVCTVPSSMGTELAGATRLTRSDFMLHKLI